MINTRSDLFIMEIELSKEHSEFSIFLTELLAQIDSSIQYLIQSENFSATNPVMIVSHEYLYGYDHDNEGMTKDELAIFESQLQLKTNEIADKYSLNIAICPGTIITVGDETSNRAYFFTPNEKIRYTAKEHEPSQIIDWNGKKIFISICCNWSSYKYDYWRPKADVYYIPSSGFFFLAEQAHPLYLGSAHDVSDSPGVIFINSEKMFKNNSGVYRVKNSARGKTFSLCKEPGHLQYLDKLDVEAYSGCRISKVKFPIECKEDSAYENPAVMFPRKVEDAKISECEFISQAALGK